MEKNSQNLVGDICLNNLMSVDGTVDLTSVYNYYMLESPGKYGFYA